MAEDALRHACGVFGCIFTSDVVSEQVDVAHLIYTGLVSLQHRGQESGGIATSKRDGAKINFHKGMGLLSNVFNDQNLKNLLGEAGIGHTRYSTAGHSDWLHCQPLVVHSIHGPIAVAHNGELVNANPLRQEVLERGVGLTTRSDSELITQMLCLTPPQGEPDGPDWKARIEHLMTITPLSYALVIMHKGCIYGVRDVYGNRPLSIATLHPIDDGCDTEQIDGWVLSSETCALLPIGAKFQRDVLPGEIVQLSQKGLRSLGRVQLPDKEKYAFCIFEYVYFARPDSFFEGQMVYDVRVRSGRQLALEAPVDADLVGSIPESGTPAAKGYASEMGLPYVEILCRNRYIGRTFIQPSIRLRKLGVASKFGALIENFRGKRIVLVDDSIVRGNTMGPIVKLLRDAGAAQVHVRIASPPIKNPCYMGINIPTKEELIANTLTPQELLLHVGADSLTYLTVEGLTKAVTSQIKTSDSERVGHCTACLTGNYPVELEW